MTAHDQSLPLHSITALQHCTPQALSCAHRRLLITKYEASLKMRSRCVHQGRSPTRPTAIVFYVISRREPHCVHNTFLGYSFSGHVGSCFENVIKHYDFLPLPCRLLEEDSEFSFSPSLAHPRNASPSAESAFCSIESEKFHGHGLILRRPVGQMYLRIMDSNQRVLHQHTRSNILRPHRRHSEARNFVILFGRHI
jgi:hypothetical protein